jgi:hypothetical protein
MGGGSRWLNPFSGGGSSHSTPAPAPVEVAPVATEPAGNQQPATKKKKKPSTVMTSMSGVLDSPTTMNRTLGGT